MLQNLEEIEHIELLYKMKEISVAGYHIMQICATKIGEDYEVLYTFGKADDMRNVKITISPGVHIPSVTDIFEAAYLYENEIHDLFGIEIDGINHDYKGGLYRTSEEKPFA